MAGQATAVSQIEAGPRWGLIGDPTGGGSSMVSLGRLVRVTRTPRLFRQLAKNEVDQTLATYGNLAGYTIEIEMQRNSAAILAAMVQEFTDATTSISMDTAFAEIAGATLCLVTDEAKTAPNPHAALTTEWYPSVVSTNLGAIANQIVNGDDRPTYTVTFEAQFAAEDADGQALNAAYGIAFRGDPDDAINETTPVSWGLPTHTAW